MTGMKCIMLSPKWLFNSFGCINYIIAFYARKTIAAVFFFRCVLCTGKDWHRSGAGRGGGAHPRGPLGSQRGFAPEHF